jgi:hypothetical protein
VRAMPEFARGVGESRKEKARFQQLAEAMAFFKRLEPFTGLRQQDILSNSQPLVSESSFSALSAREMNLDK